MYIQTTNAFAEAAQHSQRGARPDPAHLYDLICIGFGTAGLALATALSDHSLTSQKSVLFLESGSSFSGTTNAVPKSPSDKMRINFMQDLATARDPTSQYSFLNYLHETGTLGGFMEATDPCPRRAQFNEYLEWTARKFEANVAYGVNVVNVQAVKTRMSVRLWGVEVLEGGVKKVLAAKNVVFAKGGEARFVGLGKKTAAPQSEAVQMMQVTEMVQALCNSCNTTIEDEQISTLARSSGELVSSLFDGKPLFMIHAML